MESEGIGHGTTFVIKLQAISRVEANHVEPNAKSSSCSLNNYSMSKQFMEQKEAVMKSVLRQRESSMFEQEDYSNVKDLRVLLVNDEFFILCMLQQIVQTAGITKID